MKKLVSILALALMLGACQNTAQNNNTAADGDAGACLSLELLDRFESD